MEIVTLVINRPQKKNAFTADFYKSLEAQLKRLIASGNVKALIIRGAGDHFSAGILPEEVSNFTKKELKEFLDAEQQFLRTLRQIGKKVFTVAALDGEVLGKALELISVCRARIATPHTRFGLPREFQKTLSEELQKLTYFSKFFGPLRTKKLLAAPRLITSDHAHKLGIIDHLAEGNLFKQALSAARQFLQTKKINLVKKHQKKKKKKPVLKKRKRK